MVGTSNFTLYTSHSAEGRSCETKPIPPKQFGRQVLYGKRVRANWACKGSRQNKANSVAGRPAREATTPSCQRSTAAPGAQTKPIDGDPWYKQSQFARNGHTRAGRGTSAKQSQFARPDRQKVLVGRAAAKQSQFSPVRPARWTWNRQLRAERGNPPPYGGSTLSWPDGSAPLRWCDASR